MAKHLGINLLKPQNHRVLCTGATKICFFFISHIKNPPCVLEYVYIMGDLSIWHWNKSFFRIWHSKFWTFLSSIKLKFPYVNGTSVYFHRPSVSWLVQPRQFGFHMSNIPLCYSRVKFGQARSYCREGIERRNRFLTKERRPHTVQRRKKRERLRWGRNDWFPPDPVRCSSREHGGGTGDHASERARQQHGRPRPTSEHGGAGDRGHAGQHGDAGERG